MRAVKENREYTVTTDEQAAVYKKRGFDIYDDDGTLKEHGDGKKVSYEQYESLEKENKKLSAENAKLKKELKALQKADEGKKNEPAQGE